MNQPIRYYSQSQYGHLKINYPMQLQQRPNDINLNRFQQEEQIGYIQNDFQYVNQDNQSVEQRRIMPQQNDNVQEISGGFKKNNYIQNENDNDNDNSLEQHRFTEIWLTTSFLIAVLEQVIAIILTSIFYYIKGLQQYLIDENTLQITLLSFICIMIPMFVLVFIILIVYRYDKNPTEDINNVAIVSYTLIFQYCIVCYSIVQFKILNQGFLYIQTSQCFIVLILLFFIVQPIYRRDLRQFISIVIVSTLTIVLIISIYFQDQNFWWMFGIPVIAYILIIKLLTDIHFKIIHPYNNSILVFIHSTTLLLMILVFRVISRIKQHLK